MTDDEHGEDKNCELHDDNIDMDDPMDVDDLVELKRFQI